MRERESELAQAPRWSSIDHAVSRKKERKRGQRGAGEIRFDLQSGDKVSFAPRVRERVGRRERKFLAKRELSKEITIRIGLFSERQPALGFLSAALTDIPRIHIQYTREREFSVISRGIGENFLRLIDGQF